MRRAKDLSALRMSGFVVAASAVIGFAASTHGAVVSHNGTVSSVPAGTGVVDVGFTEGTALLGSSATFGSISQHSLIYDYDADNNGASALITQTIVEIITNNTSDAWSSYRIILVGADFFGRTGTDLIAPKTNPVELDGVAGDATVDINALTGSTISVTDSNIVRDGQNGTLTINFGDTVAVGESFRLRFDIGDIGDAGIPGVSATAFQMLQRPTAAAPPIPEPAAGLMLLVGSVLGVTSRRVR